MKKYAFLKIGKNNKSKNEALEIKKGQIKMKSKIKKFLKSTNNNFRK